MTKRDPTDDILALFIAPAFEVYPLEEWRSLALPRQQAGDITIPCEDCPPGNNRAVLYIAKCEVDGFTVHYFCGDHARVQGCPAEMCGDERADGGTHVEGNDWLAGFYVLVAGIAMVVGIYWVLHG
jgi:hypothetical protein